jgi:hypothetical protein
MQETTPRSGRIKLAGTKKRDHSEPEACHGQGGPDPGESGPVKRELGLKRGQARGAGSCS